MHLFTKFPPAFSIPLFYGLISLGIVVRFFLGTVVGALTLSLVAYCLADEMWNTQAFTAADLAIWFSEQPDDFTVAVAGAALTVLGFVVAFHTATINWQQQLRAQLKTQAAGEIEEFLVTVNRLASDAAIYVESLVEAVDKIQQGDDPDGARFAVDWAVAQRQEFISTRSQLSQAIVNVHTLKGRNGTILTAGWGLAEAMDIAIASLGVITNKMWLHVPVVDPKGAAYIQEFQRQVDVLECRAFVDAARKHSGPIAMVAGSIKGYLLSPVMGFPLPMYINLISNRKEFAAAVRLFHRTTRRR